MIKVSVDQKLNIPLNSLWDLLTNIKIYPKNVKYVKSVKISGPLKVGKEWEDITTILWIPMRVKHVTAEVVRNKKLSLEVLLPFGGKMLQSVNLEGDNQNCRIWGGINFDLGNPVFNLIIGPILKKRLQTMLLSTVEKVRMEQTNDS